MTIRRILTAAVTVAISSTFVACGWFDDPTPENIRIRLAGPAGSQVQLLLSTQFVAAVDAQGVTQVQVFSVDTVSAALPVDTTIYIGIDRRMFVQVAPVGAAELQIQARIDVDDRTQINESGVVRASDPWRYAYLFNQLVTRTIDIVI